MTRSKRWCQVRETVQLDVACGKIKLISMVRLAHRRHARRSVRVRLRRATRALCRCRSAERHRCDCGCSSRHMLLLPPDGRGTGPAVERSDMLAHVALQTIEANAHVAGVDDISVRLVNDENAAKETPSADVVITGAQPSCLGKVFPGRLTQRARMQTSSTTRFLGCGSFPPCAALWQPGLCRPVRALCQTNAACMPSCSRCAWTQCAGSIWRP